MANVVVVGAQWGDEGKGKIVDWLSEQADVVVRFQGGHNAGHTLVIGGQVYKLSLLPSGVVRPGKLSVIGNGVVLDPYALVAEVERLAEQGVAITRENLRVAENATLILSLHRELDALRESGNAGTKIGTTKRGIGPAYEDKVGPARHPPHGSRRSRLPAGQDRAPARAPQRAAARPRPRGVRPQGDLRGTRLRGAARCCPTWTRSGGSSTRSAGRAGASCSRARKARSSTSTTAPIPSSPPPTPSPARPRPARASGPGAVGYVLGIAKAYTTRVGEGPFPTELYDETGELIGQRGKEFGVVTGRKRRCGWFDATLVRQTVRTSGIDGIALTKLDMLDGFKTIKIGVGYRLDGETIDYFPGEPGCAGARRAGLRGDGRLERLDRRGALVGGASGAGDQVCAAGRGTDRRAGRRAVDEPGARRHDPHAETRLRVDGNDHIGTFQGRMADYYPLIARAIEGLSERSPRMRGQPSTNARARRCIEQLARSIRRCRRRHRSRASVARRRHGAGRELSYDAGVASPPTPAQFALPGQSSSGRRRSSPPPPRPCRPRLRPRIRHASRTISRTRSSRSVVEDEALGPARPRVDSRAPVVRSRSHGRSVALGSIIALVVGLIAVAAWYLRDMPREPADRAAGRRGAEADPAPTPTTAARSASGSAAVRRSQRRLPGRPARRWASPSGPSSTRRTPPPAGPESAGRPRGMAPRSRQRRPGAAPRDGGAGRGRDSRGRADDEPPASPQPRRDPAGLAHGRAQLHDAARRAGRVVRDVGLLQFKNEEGARGTPIAGLPVPVRENLFLIGLSNLDSDVERNIELLVRRNWIDLPVRLASGQRAIISLREGRRRRSGR